MLRLSTLFLGLLGLVGLYFHSTLPVTGHIRPGFFVFYTTSATCCWRCTS